jgi:hypothetical protein
MRFRLTWLPLAVACGAITASCGSSNKNSGFGDGDDGGGSGSGGSSGGGSGGSGSSSGLFGDDGSSGDGAMSGDPTTCAGAASSHSYIGCDYWPTVTANNVWSTFDYAVVVANAGTNTANITVTGPGNTNQTATVAPGQLTKIYLPWVAVLKGADSDPCGTVIPFPESVMARAAAYHLISSVPVTVYQFNALEYQGMGGPAGKSWGSCPGNQVCLMSGQPNGCFSFTNDASLLMPSTAMTGNVRVTGHGGWTLANSGAYMAVTATQNNTTVNVKVSSTGQIVAGGGIPATGAGGMLTLTMNAGDVAELLSGPVDASDLSGSIVQANNPVQVITGLPCLYVPDQAPACDHVEESNFPAETLGQDYIVVQPPAPHTGGPVGQDVRIYGNFDNTMLTYTPTMPPGCPTMINAGQVVDCGIVSSDFEVKGNNSFAVGMFTQGASVVDPGSMLSMQEGDPDQTLATAVKQYRNKYVFLAPTDYEENYAVIVAPTGASVSIDGAPTTSTPVPIGSTGYNVIREHLGPGQQGAHTLDSGMVGVGLQVTGYGSYTSYTYPGGLDLQLISPPPPFQ